MERRSRGRPHLRDRIGSLGLEEGVSGSRVSLGT